jgi:hypothetical protein
MVKMEKATMITLIAVVLFIVVGLSTTYGITEGVFGPIVGQKGSEYGVGNTFSNRGFLLHALVFGAILFFILRRQLKSS